MRYEDFFRHRPESIAPVYVFSCEDAVRVEEGVAWLSREAARLWGEAPETLWISAPQAAEEEEDEGGTAPGAPGLLAQPETLVGRLSEAAEGGSLFGGARLLWTRRLPSLTKGMAAWLSSWAASAPPTTCVGVWVARKPVESPGVLVEFARLYGTPPTWKAGASAWDNPLAQWVSKRARVKHNRALSQADAQVLIERAGEDLDLLAREIENLALYTEGREAISIDDIERLTGDRRSEGMLALAGALAAGDAAAARAALGGYFTQGMAFSGEVALAPEQAAIPLVAGLASFALDCARAQEAGAKTTEALRAIGITWMGRQQAVLTALRRAPQGAFARWFEILADLDRRLKTEGGLAATARPRLEMALAEILV